MAWMSDYSDMKAVQNRAGQAMGLPLGMASPLWFAFGAATTAGVAWWLMTRWTQALNVEALNVEALGGAAETATVAALEAPIAVAAEIVHAEEALMPVAETMVEETLSLASAETEAAIEAATPPIVAEPDDLTRLVGVGPKLAAALAEQGVTRFAQIAAWTADDIARFDAALSLKGRAIRNAWVAQAAELIDA